MRVEVKDGSGIPISNDLVTVNTSNPNVLFYEKKPTLGLVFNEAVNGEFTLKNDEITLVAYPYFFSKEILGYEWRLNGSVVNSVQGSPEVTFRNDNNNGVSRISLNLTNPSKFLQNAQRLVSLNFNND